VGEVAGKVITQFATALSEEIAGGSPTTPPAAEPAPAPVPDVAEATEGRGAVDAEAPGAVNTVATPAPAAPMPSPASAPPRERRSAEAIDLLDVAGAPVAKRLAPIAALLLLIFVVLAIRRRRG
jgi:uncharacterized protein